MVRNADWYDLSIVAAITVLAILLIIDGATAVPFEQWSRSFDGAEIRSVQQISDGGYILAGCLALSVWVLMILAGRIMHPDNPFGVSEYSIKYFFVIITLVFLISSILTVRWISKKEM